MKRIDDASILRIFISSSDKFKSKPLYQTIVFAAKRNGLAGATVFKAVMGYGSSSRISSDSFWEHSENMPLIIEIIDQTLKIESFVNVIEPWLEKVPTGCLISIEKARVLLQKKPKETPDDIADDL